MYIIKRVKQGFQSIGPLTLLVLGLILGAANGCGCGCSCEEDKKGDIAITIPADLQSGQKVISIQIQAKEGFIQLSPYVVEARVVRSLAADGLTEIANPEDVVLLQEDPTGKSLKDLTKSAEDRLSKDASLTFDVEVVYANTPTAAAHAEIELMIKQDNNLIKKQVVYCTR